MYELKTNTAVRIAVGPLVDPTDGKTAEVALTVTGLHVGIYQMANDGSAVVMAEFDPSASGGNNDMVHVTNDDIGMYDLELTAAQLNFLGNARIAFYDVDGFLVHWIDLQVVSSAYFEWKYGSTIPNVNVTQLSGDTTAADNAEAFFDGTGYAGTNNVIPTVTGVTNLHASAATAAELAKVPKSDSNVSWNATALAAINAEVDTALNTAIPGSPTENSVNERLAALDDHVTADYGATEKAAIDLLDDANGLVNIHDTLDTVAGYLDTEVAAILADTNELQTDWANGGRLDLLIDGIKTKTDGLNFTGTDVKATLDSETVVLADASSDAIIADAVWNAATATYGASGSYGEAVEGMGLTAAGIADAVWDEAIADHLGAGKTGAALNAAGSAGDPWSTAIPGSYGAGTAGKILGDNINAPIATVDTVVDGIATTLGVAGAGLTAVPWNASWDAEVQSECTDALNAYDPPTKAELDGAVSPLATAASLITVAGYIDTEVAAILAAVDTEVAAIKAKTDNLPASPAAVGSNMGTVSSVTGNVDGTIGGLSTTAKAHVNAEVVDALASDTYAEPASVPSATSSLKDKISWLFALARNKITQTVDTQTLKDDAGSTSIASAAVSDDGTTFTRSKWES